MKRDPSLYRLSWGHQHGLAWTVRIEREIPIAPAEEDPARIRPFAEALLRFWTTDLIPHFAAEEDLLLPLVRRHLSAQDPLVCTWLEEHRTLRDAFERLEKAGELNDLVRCLKTIGLSLLAHIRFEERVLFPRVEEVLTSEEKTALETALSERLTFVDE